jgi:hypothetical protein
MNTHKNQSFYTIKKGLWFCNLEYQFCFAFKIVFTGINLVATIGLGPLVYGLSIRKIIVDLNFRFELKPSWL